MNNTTTNSTHIVALDNQASLIALITFINKTISQYGLGFIWLAGNIGSAFNCAVFHRPTFRKSPCAIYFTAASVSQLFTYNLAVFIRMLEYGYDVPFNAYPWLCKIRFYLFYVFVANSRYNVILASIDRYFSSSADALRRQRSSPQTAVRLIVVNATFWSIIYLHVIAFFEVTKGKCGPGPFNYAVFFIVHLSIDSGILPVLLMLVFGLLIIKNVYQIKRRVNVTAANNANRSVQVHRTSKNEQLHRMLTIQIILFLILEMPGPFYFIYRAATSSIVKSPFRVTVESFVNNLMYDLLYVGSALTFPNFILSSSMYRQELKRLIQTKLLRRCRRLN